MANAREVVEEHLAAFNAHDSDRLLAGFAEDVIWATGQDVMRGRTELADLFDDSLWDLQPLLTVVSVVAGEQTVAAELREQIMVDGARQNFRIAVFFTVLDGLIVNAKVYREGVADLE
jgi:ketosteroid isomerase-like protein